MKPIQIVLAILLLLCLADMPYGYFQFVRYVSMVAFAWMAYKYSKEDNEGLMVTCIALAILFQPFFKIALGRVMWNIVDVVVAVGLIVLVLRKNKLEFHNNKQL